MNYFVIFFLALVTSCSNTKVAQIQKLSPLPENSPISFFSDIPQFDFEIICNIESAEKKEIEKAARDCGSDMVFQDTDKNYYVIKRTSDERKISMEDLKNLVQFVEKKNLKGIETIISKTNQEPKNRFSKDQLMIDLLYYTEASKGLQCNKSIIGLLRKYKAQIAALEIIVDEQTKVIPKDMIYCENVFAADYQLNPNRMMTVSYVLFKFKELINKYKNTKDELNKLSHIYPSIQLATSEVNRACEVSQSSDLCYYKPKFIELKSKMNLLEKKLPQSHRAQFKKVQSLI